MWKEILFLACCVQFLDVLLSESNKTVPEVKLVSPILYKEVDGITTYDTSIPVAFNISVSPLLLHNFRRNSTSWSFCLDGEDCEFKRQLHFLFGILQDDVDKEMSEFFPPNSTSNILDRPRRQLAALALISTGFFLRPAINKLTGGLFGTDNEWEKPLTKLKNAVAEDFHHLLEVHELQAKFNVDVTKTLKGFQSRMENLILQANVTERKVLLHEHLFLQLFFAKQETDEIHRAMESCRNHHIPISLIGVRPFAAAVRKHNSKLQQYGRELAIPNAEISSYLKLPIADCQFGASHINVVVNLPVKQISHNWKVYELIHTRFSYKHHVCEVFPSDVSFVAQSPGRTVLISGHLLQHCKISEEKLCLIPPYIKETSQSVSCAVGIMQRRTVEELGKSCAFKCYDDNQVQFSQVDQNTLIVTNAKKVSVSCKNGYSKNYDVSDIGNVEIKLVCACNITIDDDEAPLDQPFPCPSSRSDHAEVTQIVPTIWSNIPGAIPLQTSVQTKRHNDIYNDAWTETIPVYNVTSANLLYSKIHLPEIENHISVIHLWLVILSLIIFFLLSVIAYFIKTVYCVKRKP